MEDSVVPEFADNRAALHARAESRTGGALSAPAAPAAAPPSVAPSAPGSPAVSPEPQPVLPSTVPAAPEPTAIGAPPAPEQAQQVAPAQPAPVPPPVPQPASPADELAVLRAKVAALEAQQSAAPAAATQVSPPAPAPEPIAPPSDQDVHAYALAEAGKVPGVNQVVAQYQQINAALGREDGFGNWVPGTLGVIPALGGYVVPELDARIATISTMLDASKAAAAGLPPIDELARAEYTTALARLQSERRDRVDSFRDARERSTALADRYQRIYDHFKGQAFRGYQAQIEQQEYNSLLDTKATEIRGQWESGFRSVLTELQIDPKNEKLVQRLWGQVEVRGRLASNEEVTPDRLYGFLKTVVQGELGWVDEYHRLRSGEYGASKVQAAGAALTAPRAGGPSAPTAPAPTQSYEDIVQANRQRLRDSFSRGRRSA